jgi:hypothetical protein
MDKIGNVSGQACTRLSELIVLYGCCGMFVGWAGVAILRNAAEVITHVQRDIWPSSPYLRVNVHMNVSQGLLPL